MPDDKVITLDNLARFKTDLYADIIMDINEADAADQAVLAAVYNSCPIILKITTSSDGIQMYRLDNNNKRENNKVYYSCLLFGALIELAIINNDGTYTTAVQAYNLTPSNN